VYLLVAPLPFATTHAHSLATAIAMMVIPISSATRLQRLLATTELTALIVVPATGSTLDWDSTAWLRHQEPRDHKEIPVALVPWVRQELQEPQVRQD